VTAEPACCLLYRFSSKEVPLEALVERAVNAVEAPLAPALESTELGVFTRGCLSLTVSAEPYEHDSDSAGVLVAALVAAVSLDPGLLAPMRRAYDRSQERLEHDGLDVASATTVRLASTDGGSPPSCSFARCPLTCTERLARFLRRWPHERPPRADLPRRRDCMDPSGSATPTGVRDGRATGHQPTARR